jgi:hypothetical protein
LGDGVKGICPYSRFSTKDAMKRLSDLKYLCKCIENICAKRGQMRFGTNITLEETNKMFGFAERHLPQKESTAKTSKTHRPSQISWCTMVKFLRSYKNMAVYKDILP